MQQTLKRTSLTLLISGALSVGAVNSGWAAQVPAGVQLAQQQNIVINNGSEVANFSWFIGVFLSGAAYRWIARDERVGATAGFSALAQKE